MSKAVCNMNNSNCMLRRCNQCPGKEALVDFIQNLPQMVGKKEIRYKKWVSTDRCMLQEKVAPVDEFVDSLSASILMLLRHFIAKSQGKAFKETKDQL